jgi:DNA-binding IclR family transcriptional regulator
MDPLHARIGDNPDLTIPEGDRVIVSEQIASHESIRVISHVGMQHPAPCTANGRAQLSMLLRDKVLSLIGAAPWAFTARTVTDPQAFLNGIAAAPAGMIYTDIDDHGEAASAMAVPLPNIAGQYPALSLAMPTPRFLRLQDEIGAEPLALRADVEASHGSSP